MIYRDLDLAVILDAKKDLFEAEFGVIKEDDNYVFGSKHNLQS